MAKLIAPLGGTVSVPDEKVDGLLARGFKRVEEKKAPAKKAASSKSTSK